MTAVVYDTGVLIAADRNDRRVWIDHAALLDAGIEPLVPATVVAQASRSPRQAQLRRFLRACNVVSIDERMAHAAGALLGAARRADVIDATVVILALARRASIATADPDDIGRLVRACGARIEVIAV